jgi:hypothetical protein
MPDIKLSGPSMEARLNKRLQNSGAALNPDVTVKHGDGARRTFHNIHHGSTEHGTNPNPAMPKGKDLIGYYGKDSK